jgi:hypothetical protein
MATQRPGCPIASSQDRPIDGSASIDSQVGFYDQASQPGISEANSRAGQMPSVPDDRFTNVIGGLRD